MLNYNKYICQHKVKRFNPALGRYDYFPCGRCLPCLQKKAAVQSKKIETEINKNKYNYLITLTYDPLYIPYVNFKAYFSARDNCFNYPLDFPATKSDSDFFYVEYPSDWREDPLNKVANKYPIVITPENIVNFSLTDNKCLSKYFYTSGKDKDGKLYSLPEDPYAAFSVVNTPDDTQLTQYQKYNKSLKIPVINYYDVKLFFKKIRRSFFKYANKQVIARYESLKYFVLAEYGGKFHRPHYHIVLSTNSEAFSDWLKLQFVKCSDNIKDKRFECSKWQFGSTNFEPIKKSSSLSSYVSSYVAAIYNCPKLYTLPHFRPRTRHSSNYGFEISPDDENFCRTALNMSPPEVINFNILRNGKRSNFTETYQLYNAICPSYPFEAIIDANGYTHIFKIFAKHSLKSRNCKRFFIKRELINYISNRYPALYEQIISSTNCKEIGEKPYFIDKHFDSIYYRFSSLYNKSLTKKLCVESDYQLWRIGLRKCVEMKRLNEFLRYQEIFGHYKSLYLSSNEQDEYSQIALTEAQNSFNRQKNRKLHNDKLIKF